MTPTEIQAKLSQNENSLALVLLDSMWNPALAGKPAPPWFRINPLNHSGKRLYAIMNRRFLVGNVCATVQESANHHGKPSVEHTLGILNERRERLIMRPGVREREDLLVVGGRIAKDVITEILALPLEQWRDLVPPRILYIPHPAFRYWTAKLEQIAAEGIADEFLVNHNLNPKLVQWEPISN